MEGRRGRGEGTREGNKGSKGLENIEGRGQKGREEERKWIWRRG